VHDNGAFEPAVAWRTVGLPNGGVLMLHQRGLADVVEVNPDPQPGSSSYGGGGSFGCDGAIVHTVVTRLGRNGAQATSSPFLPGAVVPLDVALSPDGAHLAIVAAGNYKSAGKPQVMEVAISDFDGSHTDCVPIDPKPIDGQATAVGYTQGGDLVVQTREPPALFVGSRGVALPGGSRQDTGHDVFHLNSGSGIACASCHPEGGEDGRVWKFSNSGARRTQSPRGGILGTEPFHWDGDQVDLSALMTEVFVHRMGGTKLDAGQQSALSKWIDKNPLLPSSPPSDMAAVARGQALFTQAGCDGCHSGPKLTNNQTIDVGTGKAFQVPTLRGVSFRAPFMHDGCAPTLADRFGPCGGKAHGATAGLRADQISDLVSYLETL
jgi:hypothetical protein